MDIVIDTSALIAVIVSEPEREKIIELTMGKTLIGPGSIPGKSVMPFPQCSSVGG